MARAKRHFIPGYIWHITHRCHKREFLLKFSKDHHRYLQWLYQARKRYGLTVLNYMVTLESHSPTRFGYGEKRCHSPINAIGGGTNGTGIQSEKESKRCFLGGPVSCDGCRKWQTSGAMFCLYRHEYGSCRYGRSPVKVAFQRL